MNDRAWNNKEPKRRPLSRLAAAALLLSLSAVPQAQQRQSAPGAEPAPIAAGQAPRANEYSSKFDAIDYDIELTLPATGSVISGRTEILVAVQQGAAGVLPLDFTGLAVTRVRVNGSATSFTYDAGKLAIPVPPALARRGGRMRIAVAYRGTADDGLIVRDNVHGHRSVFADNWPNRARFWFPSIDEPADKATASFTVIAPGEWDVVANGVRVERTVLPRSGVTALRRHVWRITQPISPYNMVVGAADFEVRTLGRSCVAGGRCVDVSTWLFPESATKAAPSFRRAVSMVDYFGQLIAPFPYGKLAHVQSATQFGGMENATAIFYPEKALAEGRDIEQTVAHETAHQWFGDAVTEADWHDLWLSEGFADYFAALFFEHADGPDRFRAIMEASRRKILGSAAANRPIVDDAEHDLFKLLNVNNYDKGSWVLHMLRGRLGDPVFFDGIRRYYRSHEHRTAVTADLQRAMEAASGVPLAGFFDQWVYHPGFPRFRVASQWDAGRRVLHLTLEQTQPDTWPTFTVPLTIGVQTDAGTARQVVQVTQRMQQFTIPADAPPRAIVLDPDGWLLKEVLP